MRLIKGKRTDYVNAGYYVIQTRYCRYYICLKCKRVLNAFKRGRWIFHWDGVWCAYCGGCGAYVGTDPEHLDETLLHDVSTSSNHERLAENVSTPSNHENVSASSSNGNSEKRGGCGGVRK